MTPQFILRPRAESDIQSAFEWYESQMPGLGEQYLGALREKLEFVRGVPANCRWNGQAGCHCAKLRATTSARRSPKR